MLALLLAAIIFDDPPAPAPKPVPAPAIFLPAPEPKPEPSLPVAPPESPIGTTPAAPTAPERRWYRLSNEPGVEGFGTLRDGQVWGITARRYVSVPRYALPACVNGRCPAR